MANVKLILLQDVEFLGLAGEEVSVSAGYARNFLIPRKLADKATQGALRVLAANKEKIEAKRQTEFAQAKELAAKIAEVEISIAVQASDDNRLFGSINARNIADKLDENGLAVDYQRILLEAPIKELGKYEIPVKLHADVTTNVKIWVVRG
ncbi:MAG: 50S ribosomal protein L9 [Victivallaceae bacterium]|jgi:large subunit ribosomal protein L9|nr:50S ribosomal protein L9 [Victivallaceae bacterium]NLK82970.1 50S ribosomal protein L9 [Lentisphaerota bacterium]MDD3115882.1 50S ribosomal protein L9 [Victivallaceae bacterium]MDD3703204.1 50S ribosomal protein L9 [Victivallaceae bacterium]MDD4317085.1 50S ribosomal protein L9 [Victivallaceae bacterium]